MLHPDQASIKYPATSYYHLQIKGVEIVVSKVTIIGAVAVKSGDRTSEDTELFTSVVTNVCTVVSTNF